TLGADVLRIDAQPSRHRSPPHLGDAGVRRGDEPVGTCWVDTDQDPSLTARGDRHLPADQEGESAEHLLLRDVGFATDKIADAISEIFAVGHGFSALLLDWPGHHETRPL